MFNYSTGVNWENTLKILLSHCQNVKALTDDQGNTLLHNAASLGDARFVRILIDAGIDLATENLLGETPMDSALKQKCFVIIKEFIHDYEASRQDKLLDDAISAGKENIIQFLLLTFSKMSKYSSVDEFGVTPIHNAVEIGQLRMVKFLLVNLAEPNSQNKFLVSPLHMAVTEYGKIRQKARKESNSNSLEEKAKNYAEIVKLILSSCDNPDCQDSEGNTALHIAARDGSTEIVKILMPFYKNLLIKNMRDNTPVDLAYARDGDLGNMLMEEIERRDHQ